MSAVFADTFYFIALLNKRDAMYERALIEASDASRRTVTSAWILAEVGNALAVPRYRVGFARFVRILETEPNVYVVPPTAEQFSRGLALYESRPDKEWGLVDCISFTLMREMGIREALTGDHHFEQAGFVSLLKS